jgi:hypothetical protein
MNLFCWGSFFGHFLAVFRYFFGDSRWFISELLAEMLAMIKPRVRRAQENDGFAGFTECVRRLISIYIFAQKNEAPVSFF